MPTRARRRTATRARAIEASTPMCAGPSGVPASSTRAPRFRSSPANRTLRPASRSSSTDTTAPAALVSSCRMTPSAPSGSGAPVKTRVASPAPMGRVGSAPARTSSSTLSRRGVSFAAPRTSAERTAKPSIAELVRAGSVMGESTSSARTRPQRVAERDFFHREHAHPADDEVHRLPDAVHRPAGPPRLKLASRSTIWSWAASTTRCGTVKPFTRSTNSSISPSAERT